MKVRVDNVSELLRIVDKSIASLYDQIEENDLVQNSFIDEELEKELRSFWSLFFTPKREDIIECLYQVMGHPWWKTVHRDIHLKRQLGDLTTLKARILTARDLFGQDAVVIELDSDEMTLLSRVQE